MKRSKLAKALAKAGCQMEDQAFRDLVTRTFTERYCPKLTVDELLKRPTEALRFVKIIRIHCGCFRLPEEVITGTLLARRKNAGFKCVA